MSDRPRSIRGVYADIERARSRLFGAVAAGVVWCALEFGLAAWIWFVDGAAQRAAAVAATAAVTAISAFLAVRHSRFGAVVLIMSCAGTFAWFVLQPGVPLQAGWALGILFVATTGAFNVFRLPRLYAEFRAKWTPRDVGRGDVCTVRDGAQYSVVKVLDAEASRVHIKQYGLLYPDRPWHVKTSTLERNAIVNGGQAFPHLPLDRAEFLRWAPMYMRTEPVTELELRALDAWRAIQREPTPLPHSAG
jgi:hypothetical protein